MTWFVLRSARREGARAALLVVGIAVVVASTGLLLATARTSQLRLEGSLSRAFRPAYDLVVRPPSSVTDFERRHHLVRDTYLDDLFGGISDRQLAAIRAIPGIEAAPVENVGFVVASDTVRFPWHPPTSGPAEQLFRLSARFSWPGGSEGWGSVYVYVARRQAFRSSTPAEVYQREPPAVGPGGDRPQAPTPGRVAEVCGPQSQPPSGSVVRESPFTAGHLDGHIGCYSEVTPAKGSFPGGTVVVAVSFDFPLLLTAIDPRIERAWFGLRGAVVSGHYLEEGEGARRISGTSLGTVESVPVLASSTTQLDERLTLTSGRVAASAADGGPSEVARLVAAPDATRVVAHLPARGPREVVVEPAQALYSALIRGAESAGASSALLPVPQYWVPKAPTFSSERKDAVSVRPVVEPASVWRAPLGWGEGESFSTGSEVQYVSAPPANGTTGYRALAVRDWAGRRTSPVAALDVVGQFDERKLTRFAADSRVPLGTFAAPAPRAVGPAGAAALGGPVMRPTTELGGYLSAPPELLTTLPAAEALLGPDRYRGSSAAAPIGAVLVRLDGRLGTGPAARTRLAAAAAAIRRDTGLAVDVTDGSSPTPVDVTLLPWRARRAHGAGGSAVTVRDGWTEIGVSERLGSAVDAATSAVVGLSALGGILFVVAVVSALVAARRRDFAVLTATGWGAGDLARATLGEVVVLASLGAGVGLAGAALIGTWWLRVHVSAGEMSLVALAGPAIATAGGLVPVWSAVRERAAGSSGAGSAGDASIDAGPRTSASAALRGGRRRRATRTGLALAAATSSPARSVLAAVPFALGTAGTSILVALHETFSHQLLASRTLLGTALDLQTGPLQLTAVALLAAMGIASVVSAMLARNDERLHEHAVLGALGWRERDLCVLVAVEGMWVTALGATAGGIASVAATRALHATLGTALATAGALSVVGFLSVAAAAFGPSVVRRVRQEPSSAIARTAP